MSERYTIGRSTLVLRPAQERKIVESVAVSISPRVTEQVLTLEDGEKVIVTRRRLTGLPAGVDGVLLGDGAGNTRWLFHRQISTVMDKVLAGGRASLAKERDVDWDRQVILRAERRKADGTVDLDKGGLRPPQFGSLHAIAAHWSIYQSPATIVLPTGTGKTEVILAARAAFAKGTMLVVVPGDLLRSQTARKFATYGLLRKLGILAEDANNPVVGIIDERPRTVDDLKILEECNVVITTASSICMGTAEPLAAEIATRCGSLVIDEAHHIASAKLTSFREAFAAVPVLQFTATPYRRDKRLVDGEVVFSYPMRMAQRDGYFKKITFEPVYELDGMRADHAIAEKAIEVLRRDLAGGKNHLMMARCETIDRANAVIDIYRRLGPDLNPMVVHSELDDTDRRIDDLRRGEARVVVCVNMLGEGFDLPELKIAAVHDMHQSLAVLLQFTGRFTRTAGPEIGDATVIGNIADPDVSEALERLYSEDADWNEVLSELSSEAAREHAELVEFLRNSQSLSEGVQELPPISKHLLRPALSTLTYRANRFTPRRFYEGLSKEVSVQGVWLNATTNTLYFVTCTEPRLRWTRSKEVIDRQWDLFVLHYDETQGLLFLSSSNHDSSYIEMAEAVGGSRELIFGDEIFRSLGHINRLIFQNVGVKKHGRRNLSYASYTGADVAMALGLSERAGSVKNNLSGTGWEDGKRVAIGCSYKGRVWSRDKGSIPDLIKWCEGIGKKLLDPAINTRDILANVLVAEEVTALPEKEVLTIEWPVELLRQAEDRILIGTSPDAETGKPIYLYELQYKELDHAANRIFFSLVTGEGELAGEFALRVGGEGGFGVLQTEGATLFMKAGVMSTTVATYLSEYPPMVRFVDLCELDGNMLIKPQSPQDLVIDDAHFEVWDWAGVDIRKESIWKAGVERTDSIQQRVAQEYVVAGFDVVFDDDYAGEAADLVCLKEEADHIRLVMLHCKFAGGDDAGRRVKDAVEVCSQAVRSAKWKWKFRDLLRHLAGREERLRSDTRPTRFLAGRAQNLSRFAKAHRFKDVRAEIAIVQPGISFRNRTEDQNMVLAAAVTYLKETIGADLRVICAE